MKRCSPSSPQLVVLPSGSFAPLDNDISTSPNRINAELPAGNSTRPRVQGSDTIGGAK